ncbi:MAG: fibronectin type III domain-containing protein [Patescibacteria group bacterium]
MKIPPVFFFFTALTACSATLEWKATGDSQIAGYRAYQGTSPGSYTKVTDVGMKTSVTLAGLQANKKYYFAATAYNSDGLESNFSEEVVYVPPPLISLPFTYDFRVDGVMGDANDISGSPSPYWWLETGGRMYLSNCLGSTILGKVPEGSPLQVHYSSIYKILSDNGSHPQNLFQLFMRTSLSNASEEIYVNVQAHNLTNAMNRAPWNGISLFLRYVDENAHYYAGIRDDGYAVIKKKRDGIYQTLVSKKIFPGTYNATTNFSLIPSQQWIGLKIIVADDSLGRPHLSLFMDKGRTGEWLLVSEVIDDPLRFGPKIAAGICGMRSDFMDLLFDDFKLGDPGPAVILAAKAAAQIIVPNDVATYLSILPQENGEIVLKVKGVSNKTYVIEETTDFRDWKAASTNTTGTTDNESAFTWRTPKEMESSRFYRVREADLQ